MKTKKEINIEIDRYSKQAQEIQDQLDESLSTISWSLVDLAKQRDHTLDIVAVLKWVLL